MEERRFDTLAKAFAGDGASRRSLVKWGVGTGVASLTLVRGSEEVAAGVCTGEDQCDGTGSRQCADRNGCFCFRRVGGGKVCARATAGACDLKCRRNRNCPSGYVCSSGGPACCGTGKRFCVKKCA
jgi:hypothetical protein